MQTIYLDLRDTKGQQREIEQRISTAARVIKEGGLVALPTETVYGLAANALSADACRRIFEAKGRPQDNPLILTIPGQQWLPRFCRDIPPLAYVLSRKFWPGPLTLVLKKQPVVPDTVTAGLDTVAVRCPDHPVTAAIIREAGVPVAAPSANRSGRPSCTNAQEVAEDMDGRVEAIVDGGPCVVGVESTILDLTVTPPRLLRPGGVTLEELERLIGHIEVDRAVTAALAPDEKPKAPGMKYRHYAPKAQVTVVTGAPEASADYIAGHAEKGDGVICFSEFSDRFTSQILQVIGSQNDKTQQAQKLFSALRSFDSTDVRAIWAQCPDNRGLGLAIANRLKKAAGFRMIAADKLRVILGITGCTGAGKTSALDAIRAIGGEVIDCDAAYYALLSESVEMRNAINEQFPGVFDRDGNLNRKKLGAEVFARKERMEILNGIVHRFLVPKLHEEIESRSDGLYAVDAINLLESGLDELCDRTIAVTAPTELRVRRIMERDHISEEYARLRITAQHSDDYYRGKCDLELANAGESPEAFYSYAVNFFSRLVEEIREEKRSRGELERNEESSNV